MSRYITSDPKIMSGVPVIVGTRIPVSRIVFLLSEGHTLDSIHKLYPHVDKSALKETIDELITNIDSKQYEAYNMKFTLN
ncbi:DUF433 domain-containing protein [Candidatus Gottesmanbacteria bacterium]|nr:DUF433 domain-containing protein [Candidatus Gottesmanbacteria bacterium]